MCFRENRRQPAQLTGNECRTQSPTGINFLGGSFRAAILAPAVLQSKSAAGDYQLGGCAPFIQQVSVSTESERGTWNPIDFLDIRRLRSEQVAPLLHSRSIPAAIANFGRVNRISYI
jgi:hypothetical protein